MKLFTPVALPQSPIKLSHNTRFLALGSCFAERIGERLKESLFPITVNPTGISYNPLSLAQSLSLTPREPRLLLHQGLWRDLDHHSQLAASTAEAARLLIKRAESTRVNALESAQALLLTLGTAQLWETSEGRAVANCHRLDGPFRKRRAGVQEVIDALRKPLLNWLESEPERLVIITVSPVRYLRPSLVENSRGKAALLLACEELERAHPRVVYFPSFEILVDELRDYRFYAEDLVQPGPLGLSLVWDGFCRTFLDERARRILPDIEKVNRLSSHIPSEHSQLNSLGRKGLALLANLETSSDGLETDALKALFTSWKQS